MHGSVYKFAWATLTVDLVRGKDVLEVGAKDLNGSLRPIISLFHPRSYVATDVTDGDGVDIVCGAENLTKTFGAGRFDLVLCTEVLEHVHDWRPAVQNMKQVLRPGGWLLLTTRSRGFAYHGYPDDYWRFEIEDMEAIFSDFAPRSIGPDPQCEGVFFWGQRLEGEPTTPERPVFRMAMPELFHG